MSTKRQWDRRDVIVTTVGILLGVGVFAAIFVGAVGYEKSDQSLVFAANLSIGGLGFAFAFLVGYAESEWRLWTIGHAIGFIIVGTLFAVIAFVAPWATGWLFAILAELL